MTKDIVSTALLEDVPLALKKMFVIAVKIPWQNWLTENVNVQTERSWESMKCVQVAKWLAAKSVPKIQMKFVWSV